MALPDGLFLLVPHLPAGEEGIRQLVQLAKREFVPVLRGLPAKNEALDKTQLGQLGEWERLQIWIGQAIPLWFASLPADTLARMDPQLVARHPPDVTLGPQAAALWLRGVLDQLLNSVMMPGAFTTDDRYQLQLTPRTLTHALVGQLLHALQTGQVFRLCATCGTPFTFERGTAKYCSNACKTTAARRRVGG